MTKVAFSARGAQVLITILRSGLWFVALGLMLQSGLNPTLLASGESTVLAWDFTDKPVGCALNELENTEGEVKFVGEMPGAVVVAEGNQRTLLRLRKPSPAADKIRVPIPEEVKDQALWLQVDLLGWEFAGRAGGSVAFGFSDYLPPQNQLWRFSDGRADTLAEIRMYHRREDFVRVDGRAYGGGASDAFPGRRVAKAYHDNVSLLLKYEPSAHSYWLFYREGQGEWEFVERSGTDPSKRANFLHLRVYNPLNDTSRERVDVAAIKLMTNPPSGLEALSKEAETSFVSAKAWGVFDLDSATMLAGELANENQKIASINKVMTAYLITQLAAKEPSVLEEVLTITDELAKTPGSSAVLASGDRISVLDGLSALMLPSGNDMAHAFAEYFATRFEPASKSDKAVIAGQENFVAEMNRVARKIGMKNADFTASAGFSRAEKRPTASVSDLFVLARAVAQDPLLLEVMGRERHRVKVLKPDGSQRNLELRNTNALLGQPWVTGGKTGTTGDAGACLMAFAEFDGQKVVSIVLGSTSSDRRYVDTINALRRAGFRF